MQKLSQRNIELAGRKVCTGCAACASICPNASILMSEDNEGFLQPRIDKSSCTKCHMCEVVCPVIYPLKKEHDIKPSVYAAYSRNEYIRLDSTSGGIFSELALAYFQQKNYVGGAIFDDSHMVTHIITNDINRLSELRSSKYVQSNTFGVYEQVKQILKQNKKILFCGAPCQIAALRKYLEEDHDNLTTIDFICRGVNSPKVFKSYMDMLEQKFNSKATFVKFKNKKWGWHRFSMRVNFANGEEYCQDRYNDLFFIGYLKYGNFCRHSCYDCKLKGFPQFSDITLADFWGIENLDNSMDQDKGTSLVVVNTRKGESLFDSIKQNIVYKKFSNSVLNNNRAANTSLKSLNINRDEFFAALESLPFARVAELFFK